MLEGLAAWVLNAYIGEYLENLNTNQLSIALLQGYAELENVPMKRTALQKFDYPLCIRSGVIGKLSLSIPLTRLRSEPWVVTISDLYIVLEPKLQSDIESETQSNQEKKTIELETVAITDQESLVMYRADGNVVDVQPSTSGGGWWAYGASFMSAVVENIQLIANNVHIRYEDSVTIPGRVFACGFKIGRFSIQSADSNWVPGFVFRSEGDTIRKLMEFKGFSVYCDTGDEVELIAPENFRDLLNKMKEAESKTDRHHYLLSPSDLIVKMEKNNFTEPLEAQLPVPPLQVGTQLSFDAGNLELVMNDRTVIVLSDFVSFLLRSGSPTGTISSDKETVTDGTPGEIENSGEKLQLDAVIKSLKIIMNKASEGYQLGSIIAEDLMASMVVDGVGFSINGQLKSFYLTDDTPIHSRFYPEKLRFVAGPDKNLQFLFYKYKKVDLELKREFDACLAVYADDDVHFVHTQRYVLDVIQFWNHFAQVYDLYVNAKDASLGIQKPDGVWHGFRLKLRVDFRGVKLFLPASAMDLPMIAAEVSRLVAENDFVFSSSLQSVSQDNYDCLVDVLQLHLEDARLYEAARFPDDSSSICVSASTTNVFDNDNKRLIKFRNFHIILNPENLLDHPVPLDVTVARNLDTIIAKTIADMAVHTSVNSATLRLHVDTYALIRSMLENNLGEELPGPSSTAQTNPNCFTSEPWTSLEFTCDLNDIMVDCYLPTSMVDKYIGGRFARIDLKRVKFSFECFSNSAKHIDLICNEGRLIDARGTIPNQTEGLFSTIWTQTDLPEPQNDEAMKRDENDRLLGEIHYATERQCSTLTLVFSQVQLLFIIDWLNLAKDFLNAQATIQKATKEDWKPNCIGGIEKMKLEKWKYHTGDALSRMRVVTRAKMEDMKKENFKVKATLLDSEIVLVENSSSDDSIAVILKGTASLYYEDVDGKVRFECRDSRLQLFDCIYGKREESTTALTNLFSFVAEFSILPKLTLSTTYVNLGLLESMPQLHESVLNVSLSNMTAKLSYRDYLILRSIWDAYLKPNNLQNSAVNQLQNGPVQHTSETGINKVELKLEGVNVCLLDDHVGTRFPLLKMSINQAVIEDRLGKIALNTREGNGSFTLEIDYFNQKFYSWEPFVEPWKIDNVCWSYSPVLNALNLEILGNKLLDVTITKAFMQQTDHFLSYWPTVCTRVDENFRFNFTKRLDILPYVLVNQTGNNLTFETYVSSQKRSLGNRKFKANKWTVKDGEKCQFSFESDSWMEAEADVADPFLARYIVVHVDGWHEIRIPVDTVGTFFRLARLDSAKKSSLSNAVSYTRVVAAVSIDQDGRKLVTIRSALMLVNGLTDALTVRLDVTGFVGEYMELVLPPGAVCPAPLTYSNSKVLVRPGESWSYSKPISWSHITQREQVANYIRCCTSEGKNYRMCVSVKAESYPEIRTDNGVIPGHTISFVPPLIVHNLLPLDLHVSIAKLGESVKVSGGQWLPFVQVDPAETMELTFETEYFRSRHSFVIHPTSIQDQRFQLVMVDQLRRPLLLNIRMMPIKGDAVKIMVSAPFWFVNKCGLPLVIKQEATEEAAGQFDEHERARSMTPFLFSFAENGAPLKCCLRLGKQVHPDCISDWSRSFVLEPGITFKELRSVPYKTSGPPIVYNIGVEVRPGQGLYKDTNVVLLTARYLIDNRTQYKLHISQLYFIENTSSSIGQYTVAPNCSLAWHWPRQDLDLLLCVRQDDLPHWSCPFRIDQLKSFNVTLRDNELVPRFLRLEIILRGSVYYVTFTSAEKIPPPVRIENLTYIPIMYNQKSCTANHLRAILRPHTTVDYSFDDPQFKPPIIVVTAESGRHVEYDLAVLGQGEPLVYQNHFYIAFARTFDQSTATNTDEADLVLEVLPKGKVILAKKNSQRQQQLWYMRRDGYLVNAAFEYQLTKSGSNDTPLVLDILHLQSNGAVPLMLQKLDSRRQNTQRWRFTEDNRLVCGMDDLYVQAENGSLKNGVTAVLGPTQPCARSSPGVPPEQFIMKQRQKPGSGRLAVTVLLDGPTRVLQITDMADQRNRIPLMKQSSLNKSKMDNDSSSSLVNVGPPLELALSCTLNVGIGFSIVNGEEELIYCRFTGLILNARREKGKYTLGVKVLEIQADNQLWNADRWTLLYICSKFDEKQDPTFLALDLLVQWTPLPYYDSFDTFIVNVNKVALYIDEVLLWKLLLFFDDDNVKDIAPTSVSSIGYTNQPSGSLMKLYQHTSSPNLELRRPDQKQSRRCYFGILNLSCQRLYLSVVTANVLSAQLLQVKQMYNMPLIRFENASVDVSPFQQSYYFETLSFLLEALTKHFTQQLRSQAIKILGTVDFLGNPVGLFRDVSGSIQELMISGNLSGFVTGIMHGFSNSAAKFTSSLSDQVGKIAMDDEHRQLREYVRQSQSHDAMGHLLGGVKGLVIGVFGGVTSVITEPVGGVKRDGFEGLFTGVGKGVIGMVAKPVQGVLDFATGFSNATREVVSGSDGPLKPRFRQTRLRLPRVARSLQGTLHPYSEQLAAAQRTLLSISDGNLRELCLSLDHCCTLQQQTPILILISTTNVYFVRRRSLDDVRVLLNIAYSLLQGCTCVLESITGDQVSPRGVPGWQQPFLEFTLKTLDPMATKRRIKCDTMEKAVDLCQKVLYAKQQYEELERSLAIPEHYAVDQL